MSDKNPAADSNQIGGTHYVNKKITPWQAMSEWMTDEQFQGYLRGNIIKYIARMDSKGGLEDVKKARHYCEKLIEVIERKDKAPAS